MGGGTERAGADDRMSARQTGGVQQGKDLLVLKLLEALVPQAHRLEIIDNGQGLQPCA